MKKILAIGWKDLIITWRDRPALLLMLAAPVLLALGMGFITGGFFDDDGQSGPRDIPVLLVNEDEGPIGAALVEQFNAAGLGELLAPQELDDVALARQQVATDEVAAAVIIPAGFSAGILPDPQTGQTGPPAAIEVYANPARPISSQVVQAVVDGFISQLDAAILSGQVAVSQLVSSGLVPVDQAAAVGQELAGRWQAAGPSAQSRSAPVTIQASASAATAEEGPTISFVAFFAIGMAVFFLMYTVTQGSRRLVDERHAGTLARMLATPTTTTQILGGKVLGIFLAGFAQVAVLVLATTLLLNITWGSGLAVLLLIAAVAAAATGWGILIAALARTSSQVAGVGTALMLIFGILGGSFVPVAGRAGALAALSILTPNRWAMDGFLDLAGGGTLGSATGSLAALALMAAVLFAAATYFFRQRRRELT